MTIADWKFVGSDGSERRLVASASKPNLLDTTDPHLQDGYKFNVQIDGAAPGLIANLKYTSEDNPLDAFQDQVVASGSGVGSSKYTVMYNGTDSDDLLTITDRQLVAGSFGVNGLHNQSAVVTATTQSGDVQTRQERTVKIQIQSSFTPYLRVDNLDNLLAAWPDGPGVAIGDTLPLSVKISSQNGPIHWKWNLINVQSSDAYDDSSTIHISKARSGTGHIDLEFPDLGISKAIWIDFPDVGAQAEESIALLNPTTAVSVRSWATAAKTYADNLQAAGLDAQRANAIQHAYWNALITYSFGAEMAALFTTAHEYSNRFRDHGLACDTEMDLHNNAIGRSIALSTPQGNWLATVQEELNKAAFDGRFWIIDPKTNLVRRSDGHKIFQ